jgi:hypothetical protein
MRLLLSPMAAAVSGMHVAHITAKPCLSPFETHVQQTSAAETDATSLAM